MFIKNLQLINFRNYTNLSIALLPGINVFHGENGSGKTNILESIYWLSAVKSFRSNDDRTLVRIGSSEMSVSAEASENRLDKLFSIEYSSETRRKTIKENNSRIKRAADAVAKIPVVLFSPENIMMVKDEPVFRRRFIDDMLSQISAEYYETMVKYQKEVSHRNFLLKKIREGTASVDSLSIWNKLISEHGSLIVEERARAVNSLNRILETELGASKYKIRLEYASKTYSSFSREAVHSALEAHFNNCRGEEISRNTTLAGPHRDDISIYYNDAPAKQYASEGQQRITAILIKLSEGLLIREKRSTYPVVLLDDFSSELDNPNRSFVGNTFSRFKQIIITTTYRENLKGFEPAAMFHVEHGGVIKEIS